MLSTLIAHYSQKIPIVLIPYKTSSEHCLESKLILRNQKQFFLRLPTQSEIIGIGDNHNDFELIKTGGLGIAMGNGVKELKEIAEYISLTNNEEGVRHVIEKFILEPMDTIIK